MTITIIGTPDSGKSKKAEDVVCRLSEQNHRYYIATMIPYGETGTERVKKHRLMREGKGFVTIEQPLDVNLALKKIQEPEKAIVLLECISNLAANEMFERKCADVQKLTSKIAGDVKCIQSAVKDLVIVSNRFDDDPDYDEETGGYIRLMDEVNRELCAISDKCVLL